MKTLIIYDIEGYVISITQGQPSPREPVGIPFLNIDIPEGKRIKVTDGIGVDVSVTPHEVILEDIPPSETDLMKEQIQQQNQAISDLTMMIAMTQTP